MEYLTESEKVDQVVKFIYSEHVLGSSFRIQTNMFITDVHNTLNNYLMEQSYIKYKYSTADQMYNVVVYKNGLVDERFNIQVCCIKPTVNTDLFMYTNPTLYIVFTAEIPGSSVISKQYVIYKDLKMVFIGDSEYKQTSFSKM